MKGLLHQRAIPISAIVAISATVVVGSVILPATGGLPTSNASSHTGTANGVASCVVATGTGKITWTLDNDYNEPMVVTTSDDAAIPVNTTVPATGGGNNPDQQITLIENIPAPAAGVQITANLQFTWTGDGFTQPLAVNTTQAYTSTSVSSDCTVPKRAASGDVTFHDSVCVANWTANENYADVTLNNGTTATYSLNGGTPQPLTAGHYDQATVGTGSYHIILTGEDGSTLTFDHVFNTPVDASTCVPPLQATCTAGVESPADYFVEDPHFGALNDYTVNSTPYQGQDGETLDGTKTTGTPVDLYHGENVPLAGINGLGYTIVSNNGKSYDPAYVMEIHHNGVGQYGTLSGEAYTNGFGNVATGTFDVDSWKFTDSFIAYGNDGSLSTPEPLLWFEQHYPNAIVISHGVHLGTAEANAGAIATIGSTTFLHCKTDFKPVKPAAVFTTVVTTGTTVCSVSGGGSYDTTTSYLEQDATWDATAHAYTFTETPHGYGKADLVVTTTVGTTVCPTTATPVNPDAAGFTCVANAPVAGSYTIPTTTGVTYYNNGVVITAGTYTPKAGETVNLTAQPADATYQFDPSAPVWTWSKTFSGVTCLAGLAFTGLNDPTPFGLPLWEAALIGILIGLVLAIGAAVVVRRRKTA